MKTTMNKDMQRLVIMKKVDNVLRNHESARDDDSVLYSTLLTEEYGCSVNMRATTLEKRVAEGILPARDTVTRYRRLIQHIDESVRGTKWTARQNYAKMFGKQI